VLSSRSYLARLPLATASTFPPLLDDLLQSHRRSRKGRWHWPDQGSSGQDSRCHAADPYQTRELPGRSLCCRPSLTCVPFPFQNAMYGLHVCGEGGEYETVTLDCPLFHERIELYATPTPSPSSSSPKLKRPFLSRLAPRSGPSSSMPPPSLRSLIFRSSPPTSSRSQTTSLQALPTSRHFLPTMTARVSMKKRRTSPSVSRA
jgi:hypothetical protein